MGTCHIDLTGMFLYFLLLTNWRIASPTTSPVVAGCPPDTGVCFTNYCYTAKCNNFVTSTCCTDGCETYFILPDGREVNCDCPGDEPIEECMVNPCDSIICDMYPNAICGESWCGSCHAVWYNPDSNEIVDCDTGAPTKPPQTLLPTSHPVTEAPTEYECVIQGVCWHNPCLLATCHNYASSTCCSNECESYFMLPNGESATCDCDDGEMVDVCMINPCDLATCPAWPDAHCIESYCGICHPVWYNPLTMDIVDCNTDAPTLQPTTHKPTTFPTNVGCQSNSSCSFDPCSFSYCGDVANSMCCANGCDVDFILPNGDRAECNLCDNTWCDGYPDAVCLENWCGTCEAVWYDPNSMEEVVCGSGASSILHWEIRICCLEDSLIYNTAPPIAEVLNTDVNLISVLSFNAVASSRTVRSARRRLGLTWDIVYFISVSAENLDNVYNKLQNVVVIESIRSQISLDLYLNITYFSTVSLTSINDVVEDEMELIVPLLCLGAAVTAIPLGALFLKKWRQDIKRSSIQIVMAAQPAIATASDERDVLDPTPGMNV